MAQQSGQAASLAYSNDVVHSYSAPAGPLVFPANADLTSLLLMDNPPGSDITVLVGYGEKEKRWKLHKTILGRESRFFRKACKANTWENKNGEITIPGDVNPDVFTQVLTYLYGGGFHLTFPLDKVKLLHLYKCTDYFRTFRLRQLILTTVAEEINKDNIVAAPFRQIQDPQGLFKSFCLASKKYKLSNANGDRAGLKAIGEAAYYEESLTHREIFRSIHVDYNRQHVPTKHRDWAHVFQPKDEAEDTLHKSLLLEMMGDMGKRSDMQ